MTKRSKPYPLTRPVPRYADAKLLFSNVVDERIDNLDGLMGAMASVFGKDRIRNVALLIDPLSRFKLATYPVALVNRSKKISVRRRASRSYVRVRTSRSQASNPNLGTPDPWDYYFPGADSSSTTTSGALLADQTSLTGIREDTARSSRPLGVNQGEFELLVPRLYSTGRGYNVLQSHNYVYRGTPFNPYNIAESKDYVKANLTGPSGILTQTQINNYRTSESSLADQMLSKHSFGMLKDALPLSRKASLGRSIVELRDLTQTLRETVAGVASAVSFKFGTKEVSSQYLNEKFGWENTLRDVVSLLEGPDRFAKQVNYLIARQGKATTFRAQRSFLSNVSSPPTFAYNSLPDETGISTVAAGTRLSTIRICVNVGVKFPEVLSPGLDEFNLSNRISGLTLRPADLYQLIPWSWLGDWFTSMGDYIECIDAINADDSIVNYAFATYRSRSVVQTIYSAKVSCFKSVKYDSNPATNTSFDVPVGHASSVSLNYVKRKDLATVNDVKPTWDLGSLSVYQASILAALAFAKH